MNFDELLKKKEREDEFKSLLMTNVGYTTDKMNCSIMTFGQAITSMSKGMKDILKRMKGWKHNDELHTNPVGTTQTKDFWFNSVKKGLPAFTLTSYAPLTRNAKEILNPYIMIDIDGVEVTDELFAKLNSLPFVVGSAISTSGEGIWSVVKFDINAVTDGEDLKDLVQALYEEYKYDFDISIDTSCSNPNRLRYISPYDFELNDNYESIFTFTKPKRKINKVKDVSTYYTTGSTIVPPRFQFLGNQGEDYYREANMPFSYNGEEGKNYELLWSYSNAIYRCCGEDGYSIFTNYFPTTPKSILDGYWNSSRNFEKDIRDFIKRELIGIGVIGRESSIDKSDFEWED